MLNNNYFYPKARVGKFFLKGQINILGFEGHIWCLLYLIVLVVLNNL